MRRKCAPLLFCIAIFALPATTFALTLSAPLGTKNANTNGLVGYWSFDGKDFTDKVYDRSGQNNHGYFIGGATSSAKTIGKVGQGVFFRDFATHYVDVGSPATLDNITQKTASFWMKPTGNSMSDRNIVSKLGNFDTNGWGIQSNGSGRIAYFHTWSGATDGEWQTEAGAMSADDWVFVAVTYSNSSTTNDPIIYINGVATTTQEVTAPAGSSSSDAAVDFNVGRDSSGGTYYYGTIDEVRIYNRILSASEVKALYRLGQGKIKSGPSQSGLVGWWKMDEGLGTQADDSSSVRHPATFNANAPTWTNGKISKALEFNAASSQFAEFATTTVAADNVPWAASVWVYPTNLSSVHGIYGEAAAGGNTALTVNSSGDLIISTESGGSATFFANIGINRWQHLVIVCDGTNSNNFRLFINGVDTGSLRTIAVSDHEVSYIGKGANAGFRFWTGKIDDLRFYRGALTAPEIAKLYQESPMAVTIGKTQSSLVPSGLVGYWSFNGKDITTTQALDRSGFGNHSTLSTDCPIRTPGRIGQGARFFDLCRIDAGSANSIDNIGNLTIAGWARMNSGGGGYVVEKKFGFSQGYDLNLFSGGVLNFKRGVDAIAGVDGSWSTESWPSGNEWHHFAATFSTSSLSNKPTFYVDGVATTTVTNTQSSGTAFDLDGGAILYIGNRSANDSPFIGTLDEVRVYNRILSPNEIRNLYGAGR